MAKKTTKKGDRSGWTAARLFKLAREARIESEKREPKKPARRFVILSGEHTLATDMSGLARVMTITEAKDRMRYLNDPALYEIVPVAGGRTNAKR